MATARRAVAVDVEADKATGGALADAPSRSRFATARKGIAFSPTS